MVIASRSRCAPIRATMRHPTCKEDPHVGAIAGARALDGGLDAQRSCGVLVGPSVERPARPIEVTCAQPGRCVRQERVQTDMDSTGEVRFNHRVGQGEIPRRALCVPGPPPRPGSSPPSRFEGCPNGPRRRRRVLRTGHGTGRSSRRSTIWRSRWAGLARRLRTASPQALEPARPKEARPCPQRRLAHRTRLPSPCVLGTQRLDLVQEIDVGSVVVPRNVVSHASGQSVGRLDLL